MTPILPGAPGPDGAPAMLGVLGGGQLARMFVHAAQALGYRTAVLDPDPASPAALVSHLHVQAAYDDPAGLAQLAARCAAGITPPVYSGSTAVTTGRVRQSRSVNDSGESMPKASAASASIMSC